MQIALPLSRSTRRQVMQQTGTALFALALSISLLASRAQAQTPEFSIEASQASPLTGLWWNPSESGWGATITQQSYMMFVTMFVYDAAGNPTWYTVSCTISGASCSGDLLRFRGGATPVSPWNGSSVTASKVGMMTLMFTNNDSGSMTYTLDGLNSSKQITRQIFGPPPAAAPTLVGSWQGAIIETRTGCTQLQNNGARATYGQYDIGMGSGPAGVLVINLAGVTGLQCSYTGNFTTNGARLMATGALSCNDGKRGTWQSTNMLVAARAMSLELAVKLDTTETCTIAAVLGGSRP